MKKKILLLILLVILIIVVIGVIKWLRFRDDQKYPTVFEPRLEFGIVNIHEIDKDKIQLDASMMMTNPLPVGINLDSMEYVVYINQKEVIKSTYPKPFHLKGTDSTMVHFPVTIKTKVLGDILNTLENKNIDSADYTVEGRIFLSLPILKDKFHRFTITRRLPAMRIPEVALTKIQVKKFGLKHSKLMINAKINNPNVFTVNLKKLKYQVYMDDDSLADGMIDTLISLRAKEEVPVTIPVDLSLKEAAEAGWDLIFNSEKTRYRFTMQTTVGSEYNMLKNSKLRVESEGSLKEIKDLK